MTKYSHIRLETAAEAHDVEALIWDIFGPGMTARAAYALREGLPFEPDLAFVAEADDGRLVGSVRITKVLWGSTLVWMLGPLGVVRSRSGQGIGSALMRMAMAECAQKAKSADIHHVILVGDLAYYRPFGFQSVRAGAAPMPRPADPSRILVCPLNGATMQGIEGPVTRYEV
ncbi:MAG: N-acetyltransferase [Pseudomonadota bacterium]